MLAHAGQSEAGSDDTTLSADRAAGDALAAAGGALAAVGGGLAAAGGGTEFVDPGAADARIIEVAATVTKVTRMGRIGQPQSLRPLEPRQGVGTPSTGG